MALSRETLAGRIRDALEASEMSQRFLAEYIGMDESALSKALSGKRGLTSLEVARIAERLNLRTDVLLADDDAAFERAAKWAARVQNGVATSEAVGQAVATANQLIELDQLLQEVELDGGALPALPRLGRGHPVKQGESLAAAARKQVGTVDGPLPPTIDDLARWTEDHFGADVCITPLPPGVDGLALTSRGLRLILVSSRIRATRQRFTMMHELGHVIAGDANDLLVDQDVVGGGTNAERRANSFAGCVLLPAATLRRDVAGRAIDIDLIVELLGKYRVSLDVLAFRLCKVGAVGEQERDRIRKLTSSQIAIRPGRSNDLQALNEHRAPKPLLNRALQAFATGNLGLRPLADLLGADPDELRMDLMPPKFRPWGAAEVSYAL